MTAAPTPAATRFYAKISVSDGCWLWTAAKTLKGYGMFGTTPSSRVTGAHRYSYEYHVGPIPPGYQIDHLCGTPSCVNPSHLEAVTPRENIRRAVSRRRTGVVA